MPGIALADLGRSGVVTGVITQNVDLLHTKAGSSAVINLHGTYARVICLGCRHDEPGLAGPTPRGGQSWFTERAERLGALAVAPDADAVVADTASFGSWTARNAAECSNQISSTSANRSPKTLWIKPIRWWTPQKRYWWPGPR